MYSRVYVEITNVCNKSCSFCHGTKRIPQFMSEEEFCSILSKLEGITEYIYFHIMGEPLLHPDIEKFILLAKNRGFKPAITTNGSLLEKCGEKIIAAKPYKVSISVHSFEDGIQSEHTEYINSCLSFAEKASKNGILTVLRLWNKGFDGGKNEQVLKLIKEKFGEDLYYSNRGIRIRERVYLEYGERFLWPDIFAEKTQENIYCYGLKDHFGILVDGTVIPCCLDSDGIIKLGNIFTNNIDEILSSERAQAIKTGFSQRKAVEDLCRKCGYATRF